MQETEETQVWSLSREDPLEEGTATHSSILAWRIPWTEESGRLQSTGSQRVRHNSSDSSCMHPNQVWPHPNLILLRPYFQIRSHSEVPYIVMEDTIQPISVVFQDPVPISPVCYCTDLSLPRQSKLVSTPGSLHLLLSACNIFPQLFLTFLFSIFRS